MSQQTSNHTHACRECDGPIICDGEETRDGACTLWDGADDDCEFCARMVSVNGAQMVGELDAYSDVRTVRLSTFADVISDSTARTVANWWQSPGRIGATLAALASGRPVRVSELVDDIRATRVEQRQMGQIAAEDVHALEALTAWAHHI